MNMSWLTDPRANSLTPFQTAVYVLTCAIPSARCSSYGVLAELLAPSSSQAVGNALSTNPFAPVVPCHRVLKKPGPHSYSLGGFSGTAQGESAHPNVQRKLSILATEGVHFDSSLRLLHPEAVIMEASDFPADAVSAAREVKEGRLPEGVGIVAPASSSTASSSTSSTTPQPASIEVLRAHLSRPGATGAEVRAACRSGALTGHTSGLAAGYAQANLCIVPSAYALPFLLFCMRNPQACPVLDVTEAGNSVLPAGSTAPGCDLRADLPRYRVWKAGLLHSEPTDITHLWPTPATAAAQVGSSKAGGGTEARTDWVGFLLGCSFSFEEELLAHGLPVRQLQQDKQEATGASSSADTAASPAKRRRLQDGSSVSGGAGASSSTAEAAAAESAQAEAAAAQGILLHGLSRNPRNVPMYLTDIANTPAGPFGGRLVVSMRPMLPSQAAQAADITAQFPRVHGRCIHIGDPAVLGIADLSKPDFGDAVTILPGEVPVFWACGVTPQAALIAAKIPIAITHAPGHMLVLDKLNKELAGPGHIDLATAKRVK